MFYLLISYLVNSKEEFLVLSAFFIQKLQNFSLQLFLRVSSVLKMGFLLSQTLNIRRIYLRVFKLKCIDWIIFPGEQPLRIPLLVKLWLKVGSERIFLINFQKLPDSVPLFSLAISDHFKRILRNCFNVYTISRLNFLFLDKTIGWEFSLGIVQVDWFFTRILSILFHKNLKGHKLLNYFIIL